MLATLVGCIAFGAALGLPLGVCFVLFASGPLRARQSYFVTGPITGACLGGALAMLLLLGDVLGWMMGT